MEASELARAVAAGKSTASSLGLDADEAVVLHNSNRLTLRLLPCDVLARVAPAAIRAGAAFEVALARQLAATDSPVAPLDPRVEPRVYDLDGFATTLWTYHEPVAAGDVEPRDYAQALERHHRGLRQVDLAVPHFTDRVAEAQRLVDNSANSPELAADDRALLSHSLRTLGGTIADRGGPEQLLHGEPHAGNLLQTTSGLLFIDLETCCRGPVEFDIAHCSRVSSARPGRPWYLDVRMPDEVAAHYPAADPELVRTCWVLMLAMVAAWRWDHRDQFPDGLRMGRALLNELRAALDRYGIDVHS